MSAWGADSWIEHPKNKPESKNQHYFVLEQGVVRIRTWQQKYCCGYEYEWYSEPEVGPGFCFVTHYQPIVFPDPPERT